MSLDAEVRRLAGVAPFSALPREALQLLAFSCQKRPLRAGETLFSVGEPANAAFFVLEGEVVLHRDAAKRRAGSGALIGESALLVETKRPCDAKAARDSVLVVVPGEIFRRVLREFPEGAVAIRKIASARSRALIGELERLRRSSFAPLPTV